MRDSTPMARLAFVESHDKRFIKKDHVLSGRMTTIDEFICWRKSISDHGRIDRHILRDQVEHPARRVSGAFKDVMNARIKEKYSIFLYRLCCLIFSFMVGAGVLMVNSLAVTTVLEFYLQLVVGGFALAALRRRVYK